MLHLTLFISLNSQVKHTQSALSENQLLWVIFVLRFGEFIPLHWTEKQIYGSEMSPVFLCEATIQHTGMFELFPYLYLLTAWPQIHVSTLGNCFVEDQISSMVLIQSLLNYTNILVCMQTGAHVGFYWMCSFVTFCLSSSVLLKHMMDSLLVCLQRYVVKTVFSSIAASSSVTIALKCSRGRWDFLTIRTWQHWSDF